MTRLAEIASRNGDRLMFKKHWSKHWCLTVLVAYLGLLAVCAKIGGVL